MRVIRVSFERVLDALPDCLVSKEKPAEEELPIGSKTTVIFSQETLRDTIADKSGLVEETVTALFTTKGHNGPKKVDNRLPALPQGLINNTLVEN